MDTQLTREQKMARTGMLFAMTQSITPEEDAALDLPYWQWPRSLKRKAGTMGLLVRNEDAMAHNLPPDAPELQPEDLDDQMMLPGMELPPEQASTPPADAHSQEK